MTDKPIVWIGSAKEDISAMPGPVKASFGHRLRLVQQGKPVLDAKALASFGTGVFELRESFDRNAYRAMYVVNLKHAIYVLHAFMKKSASGIGLPKPDAELIAVRLKRARALDKESWMAKVESRKAGANIFADLGFGPAEADELLAKSMLIEAIADTIRRRGLTQIGAAKLCRTDQPTLSKVLRGRMESVTIDRLASWLTALGRSVEIRVRPYNARTKTGLLIAAR